MLVIFDCDGVLVDSEVLAAKVFSLQLAKESISLDHQQCYAAFKGHTLSYCLDWLDVNFKRKLSPGFLLRLEQATQQAFSEHLQPVEGVGELLDYLQQIGVPFCVASNGSHAKIFNSLLTTGLIGYFANTIFSAGDVARGKPAPDLYLHAAEVMGVPANFCLVIEDSVTGLEAGWRAKMEVLFYSSNSLSFSPLSEEAIQAPWYKNALAVSSMQQATAIIRRRCGL